MIGLINLTQKHLFLLYLVGVIKNNKDIFSILNKQKKRYIVIISVHHSNLQCQHVYMVTPFFQGVFMQSLPSS